jgi:TP901 family phage tail tape measure protein
MRAAAAAQMQALTEKRDLEEYQMRSAAAQRIVEIEQRRDLELYNLRSAEAQRLAEIQQRRDMEEYTTAQAAAQRVIEIEQKRDLELHNMRTAAAADAAAQAERQRVLNTNYLTASPSSQVHTARQAQTYASLGGDAAARYGSAAAGADALAAAEARLAAGARTAGVAQLELNDVLKQAEGAFRGAAHQAGIYGLHHGQLIALLAGGALAAGLHHIAETGAEVEFQLRTLSALNNDTTPVDLNKFVGITAGTLTSLKDAAEGVHALAQAGMTQGQAFAALPDVMRLATLGEMTVAQAAEMAVESMHAFGKSITDIGQIGDILVAVGSKSNVSVHKLAEDMKSAATTGETFGMTMQEITAAVGTLAERGLTIQPLSSAMMKLYEPSSKSAKIIKELGIEVGDAATGKFRPFTEIISDLSNKLNQFSDKGATDTLKSMGFSSRDIKAMQAMTEHLDDYMHLLHEAEHAQGKMFEAMTIKEDTVTGAWERLGSTLQGTLVKGFEAASPVIRQVENDLMHMAGSDGAVTAVANIAAGFARLTGFVVENASAIATFLGAVAGLKMLTSMTTLVVSYTVAQERATLVAQAETIALGELAAAEGAAAAGAGALATETAVLDARLAATAATGRLVSASLGWITLAVTAGVTIYELFSNRVSEADAKHQAAVNTANTVIDAYQREIDRLKEMNYQLEHVGENAKNAGLNMQLVTLGMEKAKAQLNLARFDSQMESYKAGNGPNPVGWMGPSRADLQAKVAEVDEAMGKIVQLKKVMSEEESRNSLLVDAKAINEQLAKIPLADEMSSKLGLKDPAVIASLQARRKEIQMETITEANHAEVLEKVKKLTEDINAAKQPGLKPAVDDKDAARAAIEVLQEKLRLAQADAASELKDKASENKRGELGDLELINEQLRIKRDLNLEALKAAIAERAAAGPLKPGQQAKYDGKIQSATKAFETTEKDAIRAREDLFDKMDQQELMHRAQTLKDKGQLDQAFDLEYQAKYGAVLDRLNADIANSDNAQYVDRLERYKAFLEQLKVEGKKNAIFKMDENTFNADLEKLKTRLQSFQLHSGPGTGMYSLIGNQMASFDSIRSALPGLMADQQKLAAGAGDDPTKQKAAQAALKQIQEQSATLRNEWVSIGQTIGQALTNAFGQGGTALGGLISAATSYGAKMKDIQASLAEDNSPEAQKKAVDDRAEAQIKAYGEMTSAAKGFFKTNSGGYKLLQDAEKAFRVYELTMAVANAAKKIMLEGGVTAAVLGGEEARGAAVMAGTQVQLEADAIKGESAAAVGVATQAQGDPYTAWARMAAMAAAMAALGFAVHSDGGSSESTADRQQRLVSGTVLGDPDAQSQSISKSLDAIKQNTYNNLPIAQGMLSALQSIESNIGNFASLLMRTDNITGTTANLSSNNGLAKTLTGVLPAIGGGLVGYLVSRIPVVNNLLGRIGTSIFGGKQSLDASGFTMSKSTLGAIENSGVNAMSYADITTSGGWFHSDKHSTQTTSLGAQANTQISAVITGIGDTISQAAGLLGQSGAAFTNRLNSFVVDIGKIDLKGLSAADAQAKVEAAFSKLGDQMAQFAVSGLESFQKAGEGYLQTLTRVAADYATVDTVFKSFGTTYQQVGTASIAAREHLIELAGGLDSFTSKASWFFQNMMTQGQQTAATKAAIQPTLDKYGLTTDGPDAVKKFTDLTIAMGAMGDAGAQAYTDLMNIAQAFKSITDVSTDLQNQLDDLTQTQAEKDAAARAKLDPANQLLFDQVQKAKLVSQAKTDLANAYQTESQSMQSAIDRLKTFSTSLRSFVVSLQTGNLSLLNPADKYGAAQAQFDSTLAKARAGDTTAQGNLQSAAQAFLQASKDANASNTTYQSDFNRVTAAMSSMADTADTQASQSQASLNALYAQVSQLTDLNAGVNSVVDGINNLTIAMTGGKNTAVNDAAITSLYKELLGHTPDATSLKFWESRLGDGASLASIADQIKHTDEYTTYQNSKGSIQNLQPSTQYGIASVPGLPATSDLYSGLPAQNSALMEKLLTNFKESFGALRSDIQAQTAQQVAATLKAASTNASTVSGAITSTAQKTVWSTQNRANLR